MSSDKHPMQSIYIDIEGVVRLADNTPVSELPPVPSSLTKLDEIAEYLHVRRADNVASVKAIDGRLVVLLWPPSTPIELAIKYIDRRLVVMPPRARSIDVTIEYTKEADE